MATDIAALATRWRPDVVIREDMAFGSVDDSNVPAHTGRGHPGDGVATASARPGESAAGCAAGRPRSAERSRPDGLHRTDLLATRPPSLRDPQAPYPDGFEDLRPIADDRHDGETAARHGAADPFGAADGRLRVAVTLGTVNGFEIAVLRALIDGAVAADARVVVALGATRRPSARCPPTSTSARTSRCPT